MFQYDILIPAYNAEKTLPVLLQKINLLQNKPKNIFLVDDGSDDATAVISNKFHCYTIINKTNMGKGYSLKQGFNIFLKTSFSDYLICIDADLQHPVESIPDFLSLISKKKYPLIIGNRDKNFKIMPLSRVFSNRITSFIISKITGKNILDSQCGFRAIKREILNKINLKEDGFQLESEFILRSADLNYDIQFINIPTIYNENISYIHHYKDTIKFIKLIIKEIYNKNVPS